MSAVTPLAVGDKFPTFSLYANDGKLYNNASIAGKKALLYFYPRASTPGCTAQACSLEAAFQEEALPIFTLGISGDTVEKQEKFATKYKLSFPLLADTELALAKACGVYGEKKFCGKVTIGIHRIAFLVNEEGVIEHVFNKVKTKEFAQQVKNYLDSQA